MAESRKTKSFLLSGCGFFHACEQLDLGLTPEHAQHASAGFFFKLK